MKFLTHFFIPLSVVVALAACAPATQEPEPAAEEPPCTEADMEAIKKLEEEFTAAFKRGDADAMTSMMTDDAVAMLPGVPTAVGREACRSLWEEVLSQQTLETHSVSLEEVVVDRGWAFVRATTETVFRIGDGEPQEAAGKYINILQRQADGSWKIARDIWNSDNPPPGS